jgi:hypothetical protein
MRTMIRFAAMLAFAGTAFAQTSDNNPDQNWFRKYIKNERRIGSFRLPAQPQDEWYPGGTYYRLPNGTLRAVDDGWIAPPGWIPVGYYLPSRKIQHCQPQRYKWAYVRDAGRPGWPGEWSLVPDN